MKRSFALPALLLLVLAACSPKSTALTVNGFVYDASGAPLAGVRLQIADRPLTTTAADGSFSVDQVQAPYRLIVEFDTDRFAVYDGLTSAAPQIFDNDLSVSLPDATITGDVTGTAAGNRAVVTFASPGGLGFDSNTSAAGSTPYSLTANLFEPIATGRLYALEWTLDGDNNADTFTGYAASGELTVAGGGTFPNQDLALAPAPSTHDLAVSLNYPNSDYDLRALTGGLRPWPAGGLGIPMLHTVLTPVPDPATVRTPNLPSARTTVNLLVEEPGGGDVIGAAWTSVAAGDTAASLTVPGRLALLTPADAATNVGPGTPFSWSNPAGGLVVFTINTGPIQLVGFTADTSFELPDLSSFGAAYGAGAGYGWGLFAFGFDGLAEATADALVQGDAGRLLLLRIIYPLLAGFGLDEGGYAVASPERSFTTP